MRYALILSFILGFSAFVVPLQAQADEVGSGFCKYCLGGDSLMTTQSVELEADSTDDTNTQSEKTGSWNTSSRDWWSLVLEFKLFTLEK